MRTSVALFATFVVGAMCPAATSAQPADASGLYFSCASCHGEKGEGVEAKGAPALAGLDEAYLRKQLHAFASGARGAKAGDSYGGQMALIAAAFDPATLDAIAAYAARFEPVKSAGSQASDADLVRGRYLYGACVSCHGERAEGDPERGAPRLRGLGRAYVSRQIRAYLTGRRGYAEADIDGQAMAQTLRASVTGPRDPEAVAAYIESLD